YTGMRYVDPLLIDAARSFGASRSQQFFNVAVPACMPSIFAYYAVRQGKAAFGLEASKEIPVEVRAYYHLLMVESFLAQAGVEFTRGFALTPEPRG
ncbi:ABC transporter permease subunit, partial [Desulfovibrio desulfuricans]|uniref:M99 family carboxypeptidase catalytic domain-containing protein n=1 Tax=Desulfovibrio desulfuricans TaxID=876 RepID=UPI00210A6621